MVSGPSTRFLQDGMSSTESKVGLRKAKSSFASTRKYSSSYPASLLRQEQMRETSQPTQIQERGAGVARLESPS